MRPTARFLLFSLCFFVFLFSGNYGADAATLNTRPIIRLRHDVVVELAPRRTSLRRLRKHSDDSLVRVFIVTRGSQRRQYTWKDVSERLVTRGGSFLNPIALTACFSHILNFVPLPILPQINLDAEAMTLAKFTFIEVT